MDKIINKITNVFQLKYCSRKNYWIFFGLLILLILILIPVGYFFDYIYEYGFYMDRYWTFLGCLYLTLNIIMQIKRLRDANISPHILWLHLLRFLNLPSLTFILDILLIVLLLLPTQRPPTTNLVKE